MISRILVAYDGSESGDRALQFALQIARQAHAELCILGIEHTPRGLAALAMSGFLESASERFERMLANMSDQARAAGMPLRAIALANRPAKEIVRQAAAQHADLIVLGHCGPGRRRHWPLTQVAQRIWDCASCTVAVVK